MNPFKVGDRVAVYLSHGPREVGEVISTASELAPSIMVRTNHMDRPAHVPRFRLAILPTLEKLLSGDGHNVGEQMDTLLTTFAIAKKELEKLP